jgi:hypothetical protein
MYVKQLFLSALLAATRMRAVRLASAVVAAVLSIGVAQATYLVNAGFATGDTTGWTASDPSAVSVVTSITAIGGGTSGGCCGDPQFFAAIGAVSAGGLAGRRQRVPP